MVGTVRTIRSVLAAASLTLALGACTAQGPQKTSLEIQAIQTSEFETAYDVAFASVMSVFQDQGYIIKAADKSTGLITADSPTTQGMVLFVGQVMKHREASAFVELTPAKKVRVRLNFVDAEESSSGYGMRGAKSTPVMDPVVYQQTFESIQKAIFVRSNVS